MATVFCVPKTQMLEVLLGVNKKNPSSKQVSKYYKPKVVIWGKQLLLFDMKDFPFSSSSSKTMYM